MTLAERLASQQAAAVRLYLQRQQIEASRQQLAQQATAVDLALMQSDGAIAVLEALIAEDKSHGV